MFPYLSPTNSPNVLGANPIALGCIGVVFRAVENLSNLRLREFRFRVRLALCVQSSVDGVSHILGTRHVFKVLDGVVGLVAVLVIHLMFGRRTWTEKRGSDKNVKGEGLIPVFRWRAQLRRPVSLPLGSASRQDAAAARAFVKAPHTAIVGHFVEGRVFQISNWTPLPIINMHSHILQLFAVETAA